MPKSLRIVRFSKTDAPITDLVTKFGGQPIWHTQPQWPISPRLKLPMRFIAQIVLEPQVFGGDGSSVAYVFYSEGENDRGDYVCGHMLGDGESAVIIQPGGAFDCAVRPFVVGPSLYEMVPWPGQRDLVERPVEHVVELLLTDDPEYASDSYRWGWDREPLSRRFTEEQNDEYLRLLAGSKIGGTPLFLSNEEFPPDGDWLLLFQLDQPPFALNCGDAGVAYAWIDPSLKRGTYFSQSC